MRFPEETCRLKVRLCRASRPEVRSCHNYHGVPHANLCDVIIGAFSDVSRSILNWVKSYLSLNRVDLYFLGMPLLKNCMGRKPLGNHVDVDNAYDLCPKPLMHSLAAL